MRKSVLEGNILPKAKQRLIIDGYSSYEIMPLTRDVLNHEIGVIELPDQTKVPGGRRRAGEFNVTIQFGRDRDRLLFQDWAAKCIDVESGGDTGISRDYKKDLTLIYLRLLNTSRGTDDTNGNANLEPVKVRVIGAWVSAYEYPDYDMNSDEGDGFSSCQVTIQYDDVIPSYYGNDIDRLVGQTSTEQADSYSGSRSEIGGNMTGGGFLGLGG